MNTQAHPWWSDAVVYQVYPRSFADSDGDGIGDLPGVTSRLPYLEELGVDAIWLTPFYPSPLADGGYDVTDYCDVDPRLGTLDSFDTLLAQAKRHRIRVIIDLVPNHCAADHRLFQAALAAPPGSRERDRFIFREGRGPDGGEPPNNWPSAFGGPAWTRVSDGQWYLHLFDSGQPDWNWRDPEVRAMFEEIIRFWLDRGVAGLRVDVAHGLFKDPGLADAATAKRSNVPSGYYHRPEIHELYRTWRVILDSYGPGSADPGSAGPGSAGGAFPGGAFPGERTAIGEVWADRPATLAPYLAGDGLPQVFNFELITSPWNAAAVRAAIDGVQALAGGARAPWVLGNHDVVRPVTRLGSPAAARAAALLLLALPGSAYIYQGEELGLPEVTDIPDAARQDPAFFRTKGEVRGRDGSRVPLPWSSGGACYGFSRTSPRPGAEGLSRGRSPEADGDSPAPPWLPFPPGWGGYSVETQHDDPDSFLSLYRTALRLRRAHPALGLGPGTADPGTAGLGTPAPTPAIRWLGSPAGTLVFERDPGFTFAANLSATPFPLPDGHDVLLTSGPLTPAGALPPDTAAWLAKRA